MLAVIQFGRNIGSGKVRRLRGLAVEVELVFALGSDVDAFWVLEEIHCTGIVIN